MTRFMISLEHGVDLVWRAFDDMAGGEIYVKKTPSMQITEIASAIAPDADHEAVGIRPGEKLHEQMIGIEDAPSTFEYPQYFKILPKINDWFLSPERIKDGVKVAEDFTYVSNRNLQWMTKAALRAWITDNAHKFWPI